MLLKFKNIFIKQLKNIKVNVENSKEINSLRLHKNKEDI